MDTKQRVIDCIFTCPSVLNVLATQQAVNTILLLAKSSTMLTTLILSVYCLVLGRYCTGCSGIGFDEIDESEAKQ